MDMDRALEAGPVQQQLRLTIFLSAPWAILGLQTLLHVFAAKQPVRIVDCTGQDDCVATPLDADECGPAYVFESAAESVRAEFDLVCERETMAPLLASAFFLGVLLGATSGGYMADRFGRRPALVLGGVVIELGAGLCVLAGGYGAYLAGRLITGFGCGIVGVAAFVLNAELLSPRRRSWLGLSGNAVFAMGVLLLCLFAWALSTWRALSFMAFLAGLPLLAMARLPESPKWLIDVGRPEEASLVLQVLGVPSGVPGTSGGVPNGIPNGVSHGMQNGVSNGDSDPRFGEPTNGYSALFNRANAPLPLYALCSGTAWFACSFGYYGLSLNSENLDGSLVANTLLSALVEFPSYAITPVIIEHPRLGRRGSLVLCLAAGALACTGAALSEWSGSPGAAKAFSLAGKLFVATAFAVVYLYGVEIFPTPCRSAGLGWQSFCARSAGILAPRVPLLASLWRPLPTALFALPMGVAALFSLRLPETRGCPLPQSVDDVRRRVRGGSRVRYDILDVFDEEMSPAAIGRAMKE